MSLLTLKKGNNKRVSELEERALEIIRYEQQREERHVKKIRILETRGTISRGLTYV